MTRSTVRMMNVPELFAARAPGNICLSAIDAGCRGSIENPVNHSSAFDADPEGTKEKFQQELLWFSMEL